MDDRGPELLEALRMVSIESLKKMSGAKLIGLSILSPPPWHGQSVCAWNQPSKQPSRLCNPVCLFRLAQLRLQGCVVSGERGWSRHMRLEKAHRHRCWQGPEPFGF